MIGSFTSPIKREINSNIFEYEISIYFSSPINVGSLIVLPIFIFDNISKESYIEAESVLETLMNIGKTINDPTFIGDEK